MNIIPVPTNDERVLVAACLLTEGVLIGSVDEIWTHQSAYRALATFRMCIEAIGKLVSERQGVHPSFVKAVVMQMPNIIATPFALDEMAEFLTKDARARKYWDGTIVDDRFPHICPLCKRAAAFIGLNQVECKARCVNSSSKH